MSLTFLNLSFFSFFPIERCKATCKTAENPETCKDDTKCAKDDDCCSQKCKMESGNTRGHCVDKGINELFCFTCYNSNESVKIIFLLIRFDILNIHFQMSLPDRLQLVLGMVGGLVTKRSDIAQ